MASDKAMELARELVNDLSYMLADSRVCRAKATELLASRLEPIVEAAHAFMVLEDKYCGDNRWTAEDAQASEEAINRLRTALHPSVPAPAREEK
jgi:hypothetical protein